MVVPGGLNFFFSFFFSFLFVCLFFNLFFHKKVKLTRLDSLFYKFSGDLHIRYSDTVFCSKGNYERNFSIFLSEII